MLAKSRTRLQRRTPGSFWHLPQHEILSLNFKGTKVLEQRNVWIIEATAEIISQVALCIDSKNSLMILAKSTARLHNDFHGGGMEGIYSFYPFNKQWLQFALCKGTNTCLMWPTIHSFWKRSNTVLSYPLTYLMAFKLELATQISNLTPLKKFQGTSSYAKF